jgi:hypothetical protein
MKKVVRAVKSALGLIGGGDEYGFIGKWHIYHRI